MPYADINVARAHSRAKHHENKEGRNARRREAYRANKTSERQTRKKWYCSNREKVLAYERARQYKVKYGITVEQYDEMLTAQKGKCAICKRDDPGHPRLKNFSVDHCHKTGRVRGLLCLKCNSQLGWYEQHTPSVQDYLERAK